MAIIDYKGDIHRDTSVIGYNVYAGNGQGCDTVWYKSVQQARKVIKLWGKIPNGHDAGLCHLCKSHYSYGSKEWQKAPFDYACKAWKKKVAEMKLLPHGPAKPRYFFRAKKKVANLKRKGK